MIWGQPSHCCWFLSYTRNCITPERQGQYFRNQGSSWTALEFTKKSCRRPYPGKLASEASWGYWPFEWFINSPGDSNVWSGRGLADFFYKGSASQYFKLAFPVVSGTPVQLCRCVKTAGDLHRWRFGGWVLATLYWQKQATGWLHSQIIVCPLLIKPHGDHKMIFSSHAN